MNLHRTDQPLALSCLLGLLFISPGLGAPGDPDPTFGTNGAVVASSQVFFSMSDVVQTSDGELVLAGQSGNRCALVRYLADGTPDASFGPMGVAETIYSGSLSEIELTSGGDYLAAGSIFGIDFGITRILSDGSIDPTFGNSGLVRAQRLFDNGSFVGDFEALRSMVIQPDGGILCGGQGAMIGGRGFALTRHLADGTPDETFGVGGLLITNLGTSSLNPDLFELALQADGRIVAVGTVSPQDYLAARFNPDGTLDAEFGNNGVVLVDLDQSGSGFSNDNAYAVAVQGDGRILVAGRTNAGESNTDVGLVRLLSDGSIDTTFGADGLILVDFGVLAGTPTDDIARKVLVEPDGKIVVAGGFIPVGGGGGFGVARLLPDGSLDSGFGTDGMVVSDHLAGDEEVHGMIRQADARIVTVGHVSSTTHLLKRYLNDASTPAPILSRIGRSGSSMELRFTTNLDAFYEVQYSEDLRTGAWIPLTSDIPGTGQEVTVSDLDALDSSSRRIYRIALQAP